jgi:branched-chain amino acid transport system substrate-binding protein
VLTKTNAEVSVKKGIPKKATNFMKKALILLGVFCALTMGSAAAQNTVKIGYLNTFSGPGAALGQDMRDAFELALDHLGREMGGLRVEMIYEDDQLSPEIGRQKTEKLLQSDKVNFISGYFWSNVLLASLKPVVDSETFLISANAGPSQIAGELCSPFFFSTSWQNDQMAEAVGEYMNEAGVKTAFLIGPNYAAGRDVLAGVKSTFKGEVLGELYTTWPSQLDFAAELTRARAARPDAIFAFYPGASGMQFLTQYAQWGLRGNIPLYTYNTLDQIMLPRVQDLALGVVAAQHWVSDLPNDANRKFVDGFVAKYNRVPSHWASQSYDAAMLINSAVVAAEGDLSKKDLMRDEMKKANYDSVRGPYQYGNNHFPIQNFYLKEVVKDSDGNMGFKTVTTIIENGRDSYHQNCPME